MLIRGLLTRGLWSFNVYYLHVLRNVIIFNIYCSFIVEMLSPTSLVPTQVHHHVSLVKNAYW